MEDGNTYASPRAEQDSIERILLQADDALAAELAASDGHGLRFASPRSELSDAEFTMAKRTQSTKTEAATQTAESRKVDWDFYTPEGRGQTDEQIRADIHEALRGESGLNTTAFSVSVTDGIVTLSGGVHSESEQRRLSGLVRTVPSVKEVRDQTRV